MMTICVKYCKGRATDNEGPCLLCKDRYVNVDVVKDCTHGQIYMQFYTKLLENLKNVQDEANKYKLEVCDYSTLFSQQY